MFMYDHHYFLLIISSFLLFLPVPFCTCIVTITSSSPLKDGDILVSSGESFALGFFSLNNSTNRYVGIWYNKVSEPTFVWVANRDHPLNSTGGVLFLDDTGNLVLHDGDRNSIWSTNVSATGAVTNNSFVQLLDSGNLVLFRGEPGDGFATSAWQSFDHPTDTTLPNMKIGWDRRTGLNRFTTSWKASNDPGTGEYSFKMDFVGSTQMYLYRGMTPIWRAGSWNGLGWSGVPEMTGRHIFNGSYIDDQDENTVVWGMDDSSIFARMIVNETGFVQRFMWRESDRTWVQLWYAPADQCDNYNHCGSFGYCVEAAPAGEFNCNCFPGFEPKSRHDWDNLRDGSGGCTRKSGVNVCRNGEGFKKIERVKVPDTSTARVDMSMGLEACGEMCLRNCSCVGYASSNFSSGGGCINWFGNTMLDTKQYFNGGQDLYIRVDAAELAKKSFNRHRVEGLVIASVGAVVLILLVAFWFTRKQRAMRRQRAVFFNLNSSTSLNGSSTRKEIGENGTNGDFHMFDLNVLVAATGNFIIANKLGEGGFGSVFKGQLPNGQEIAVKRLSNSSGQGMEEFTNEVTLIAKLQHNNLVRLLGCCVQKEEKMLVYEYLPNKGLDCFIFDKEKSAQLDWRKRFDIILGIVRGLLYLHQDSRFRIVHRDLKASNVLLDADLNPKISDFGMARLFGRDQVEARTHRVVGTYGYMAPEYAMEGMFSTKSDVFSLGILLLEIIAGRKNSSYYKQNLVNLIGHVWELWREGKALSVVDSSMGDSYEAREVLRCIHVSLLCVQEHANDRPTMSEVAFMLCNETNLRSPNQPAFIFTTLNLSIDSGSASVGTISNNEATITDVEGR